MPSSENGNRVPNSAMRFDVQPSARDAAEIFLVLVFWAVIGYGTLLYLLLAPITRHLQFPSWILYLCFVFPALSRVYTLATLFWKSGANSRKVFVDEKGVYVEEKKGAVCAYMWDSLEGFCFTRMSSIHKGFNVISLFRSPSMNLNFEGGKQVEIYNVFCGRQNLVFVEHIFYELYKSSRGNTVLKTRILEAYPILEAAVLNWSGVISEEPMGGMARRFVEMVRFTPQSRCALILIKGWENACK